MTAGLSSTMSPAIDEVSTKISLIIYINAISHTNIKQFLIQNMEEVIIYNYETVNWHFQHNNLIDIISSVKLFSNFYQGIGLIWEAYSNSITYYFNFLQSNLKK